MLYVFVSANELLFYYKKKKENDGNCQERCKFYIFSKLLLNIFPDQNWYSKTLFSQHSGHLIPSAHHKHNFLFFYAHCKYFGTIMQMIMYNCLLTFIKCSCNVDQNVSYCFTTINIYSSSHKSLQVWSSFHIMSYSYFL